MQFHSLLSVKTFLLGCSLLIWSIQSATNSGEASLLSEEPVIYTDI